MLCLYKISQMMSICVTRKEGNIRNDINIFPSSLGLNASGQLFSPRFSTEHRGDMGQQAAVHQTRASHGREREGTLAQLMASQQLFTLSSRKEPTIFITND
jgi:hypothetical protein